MLCISQGSTMFFKRNNLLTFPKQNILQKKQIKIHKEQAAEIYI